MLLLVLLLSGANLINQKIMYGTLNNYSTNKYQPKRKMQMSLQSIQKEIAVQSQIGESQRCNSMLKSQPVAAIFLPSLRCKYFRLIDNYATY